MFIKTCSKCREAWPLAEAAEHFHKASGNFDGLNSACKQCMIAKEMSRYYADWDRIRVQKKVYYQEHRDEVLAKVNERWQNNKAKILAQQKVRYLKHKVEIQARVRARRAEHNEEMLAKERAYRERNKARIAAQVKAYRLAHLAQDAAYTAKRRAIKKYAGANLTLANRFAIEALYADAARLTKETGVPHAVDHKIPLQGGIARGRDHPDNMQVLTRSENSAKSNKVFEKYLSGPEKVPPHAWYYTNGESND